MTLPALDIPLALPFEIPLLIHPAAVHFAIALPIIILLLEFSNLAFKRRALSVISLMLMLLLVVVYFAAFFTGKTDGSEAGPLLSSAGLDELKEHKLIGTYLVYASILLVAVKAFSMMVARGWAKGLFYLVLILFIAGALKQGKDGGELVYEYGANVKIVLEHEDTIDDLNDELDELKEQLESAKSVSGATLEAVKEVEKSVQESTLKTSTTKAVEEAKERLQQNYDKAVEVTTEAVESVAKQVTQAVETVSEAVIDAMEESKKEEVAQDVNVSALQPEPFKMPARSVEIPRGVIATH